MTEINQALGKVISKYRTGAKISQEELADRAGIHRTYVSQIERGLKSPTLSILLKISKSLNTTASILIAEIEQNKKKQMTYLINSKFNISCGFQVNDQHIKSALHQTNESLETLPSSVYRKIDIKTTSSIIGSMFCQSIASTTGAIVNPIEKGYPDIIPKEGENSSEELLRNYPLGLEIKCTIGSKTKGDLRAGESRITNLKGIVWQAHHREVKQLLGLVWDFVQSEEHDFNYPKITAIFYSDNLVTDDWGQISGMEGRNTKVCSMVISGKQKMANGWVAIIDDPQYKETYQKIMNFSIDQ